MYRLLEPCLILAALLAARPVLAVDLPPPPPPPADVAAPAEAAEPVSPPEAEGGDEGTAEPVADETLTEEAEPAAEEEVDFEESGYADASGNLENLEEMQGLRVSVRTGGLRAKRGFTPLEVTLSNGDAVPRAVRLLFRGYGSGGPTTVRELEVAPRQRLTTHLLLPAPMGSGTFSVESPGLPSRQTGVYLDEGSALAVLVLGTSKGLEASTGLERSEDRSAPQVNARFMSAQDAPRELAAYVGYPVVLVTEEPTAVPPDVWAALENHAAAGGSLVLARPPRDVRQRLPLLSEKPERQAWYEYGFGEVYLCETPAACLEAVLAVDPQAKPPLDPVGPPPRWASNRMALRDGENPLLPNALAPVGRFLVLIFLFSLVAGPGGMMLARRKGPAAMLIGVPAVALLTCLIIIADSVLGDGFVTHASRYSYTWLDRPRDRVVTASVAGYYANLATEGVRIPSSGVLLAPDQMDDWLVDVDWRGGGLVADGFLPSRTYMEWGELAVVPTRARLVMRREGETWKVQNALGAPLEEGIVQLGGKQYTLPPLADGAEGVAMELTQSRSAEEAFRDFLKLPRGMERRSQAPSGFTKTLDDGAFLVRVGGAGFGPLAALEVQLHEGIHYVRGQVDRP